MTDDTKLADDRTLVLIKPDATAAGHADAILKEVCARCGLTVATRGVRNPTADLIRKHYVDHIDKAFYPALADFMTSGPLEYAVLTGGDSATRSVRALLPELRKTYGTVSPRNAVHASDDPAAARREIALWVPASPVADDARLLVGEGRV